MLGHAHAVGGHPSATTAATAAFPSCQPTEPRYMHLPDSLYALRHRFPAVTESIFLECTRCHQWVSVPVLPSIPKEVAEDVVAASAVGLEPIETRTRTQGPLRHVAQDQVVRKERLAQESVAVHWRSQRLQQQQRGREEEHNTSAGTQDGSSPSSSRQAEADDDAAAQSAFERILRGLRARGRRTTAPPAAADGSHASAAPPTANKHPPFYIPNPDTFVCAGWQCSWEGDALADLRRSWMDRLYAALPMPSITEDALSSLSSSSTPSSTQSPSTFPAAPGPGVVRGGTRQQRRAALNATLAEELHVNHPRRHGRGYGAWLARFGRDHTGHESLPSLSLPSTPLAPAASATEAEAQLSRLQQTWVRQAALLLLRNGAEDVHEADKESASNSTTAAAAAAVAPENKSTGALLSAYCWAVCDACGKLRRVAQPFPGGAPFVCAMAVTQSSSCRAASATKADGAIMCENSCSVSEVEGLVQCGVRLCEAELMAAALSSPFLPYPLKAQLASGSWDSRAADATEPHACLSRMDVLRVLLAEPLLKTIRASVTEAITDAAQSSGASSSRRTATPKEKHQQLQRQPRSAVASVKRRGKDAEVETATAFLQRSLPVLRELSRAIKKRSTSSIVRQLLLTPAQIRAKREAVVRSSLLDDLSPPSPDDAATNNSPTAVAAVKHEASAEKVVKASTCVMKEECEEEVEKKPVNAAAAAAVVVPLEKTQATSLELGAMEEEDEHAAASDGPRPRGRRRSAPMATTLTPAAAAAASVQSTRATLQPTREAVPPPTPQLQEVVTALQETTALEVSAEPPVRRKRGRPPKAPRPDATPAVVRVAAIECSPVETTEASLVPPLPVVQVVDPMPLTGHSATTAINMDTPIGAAAADVEAAKAMVESPPHVEKRARGRPVGSTKTPRTDREKARRTRRREAYDVEEQTAADAWEIVHWVQCDSCSKWRIVPEHVPATVRRWECHMRFDAERGRPTTCDDPDDADLSP